MSSPIKPLDPVLRQRLIDLLATGMSARAAAFQVGMAERTARKIAEKLREEGQLPAQKGSGPDPVDLRRHQDRAEAERRERLKAERRAVAAEDVRKAVFGLVDDPLRPVHFGSQPASAGQAETVILFLSDLHWGERVDLAAMDGLNSYSLDIARARLGRWVRAVIDLVTRHWAGPPPERILLILGGDLVSGEIHAELSKTNEAQSIPAVADLVGHLLGAIEAIVSAVQCPVDIVSLPGNHGRSTMKPESKQMVETSFDTLVSLTLEKVLGRRDRVRFFVPPSPDALFSVYGWHVLATHGDRIGSRGGQGFVGPAATAARGMKRMVADYAARKINIDLILMGHLHTPLMLEEGFVNGSLPGPTEYSRDGRFRPHPCSQLFLTMHPRRRIAQVRWIETGHIDEGSLYIPPSADATLRPRYRVPAISVPS